MIGLGRCRFERGGTDAFAKVGIVDSACCRGLREKARGGHPGQSVYLDQPELSVPVEAEVRPAEAGELEGMVCECRDSLRVVGDDGTYLCRKHLFYSASLVLLLVGKRRVSWKDDFAEDKRCIAEDADR